MVRAIHRLISELDPKSAPRLPATARSTGFSYPNAANPYPNAIAPPGSAMPKRSTLRLTIRSITALPAPAGMPSTGTAIWAGFGVRVQRNGRKVHVVQSRGPAGSKRVTLGPFHGIALDRRRHAAAKVIDRIKRGLDPISPEPEPDPTVVHLAARCMRAYVKVQCKPKTQALSRNAIDKHILPALGNMLVKDVRSQQVIDLQDRMRDTPSMPNHVVGMLSKMFSLDAIRELVPHGRKPCKRSGTTTRSPASASFSRTSTAVSARRFRKPRPTARCGRWR